MEVKYTNGKEWFCFRHAVIRVLEGEEIHPEIDDFGSEYDMRDTLCKDCYKL